MTTGHLSETDCSGPTSRQSEISLAEMSPVLLSGEIPQTESMCEEAESPCSADSLSSFSVSSPGSSECEEKDIQSEGEQPGSPTEHVSDAPSAFSVKGFDLTTQICKCTTTTVAEVLVLLLSFLAKHRPTVSALVDILQLFNVVFQKDILPSTKYLFNKAFSSPSLMMQYHMYCEYCLGYVGIREQLRLQQSTCPHCHQKFSVTTSPYFLMLPLAPQLKFMLENQPGLVQELQYRNEKKHKNISCLEDIFDGTLYQELSKPGGLLSFCNNFSFSFNTDGAPVFKSSRASVWPIHIMLNELPPVSREKNLLLAGLWYGKGEPNMDMFLKSFVDDAKHLATIGVTWKHVDGTLINSKFVATCCCVDSVARPAMQKLMQFNGYYSCGWCYHPGENVGNVVKYPVGPECYPDRTNETMEKEMEQAFVTKTTIFGVKGPSALINMPKFGIVSGFVPDYMHAVLLGVVRQLAELWFSSVGEKFYIGEPSTVAKINKRLERMFPPKTVSRLPRPISERRFWKASEWKCWLLYYAFPCLDGILPRKYLKHFALLSQSVYALLKDSVTHTDVNNADLMLTEFVCGMQELYTKTSMTYNVHLLTHLPKSVKEWGPLWAHSAFAYESANGFLLKLAKGTRKVPLQIAKSYLLYRSVYYFVKCYIRQQTVQGFCEGLLGSKRLVHTNEVEKCHLIGKGLKHGSSHNFFGSSVVLPGSVCTVYKRVIAGGELLHSKEYGKCKRRNNSFVQLKNGLCGEILKICVYKENGVHRCVLLLEEYVSSRTLHVTHVNEYYSKQNVRIVSADNVLSKFVVMRSGNRLFASLLPNYYEKE